MRSGRTPHSPTKNLIRHASASGAGPACPLPAPVKRRVRDDRHSDGEDGGTARRKNQARLGRENVSWSTKYMPGPPRAQLKRRVHRLPLNCSDRGKLKPAAKKLAEKTRRIAHFGEFRSLSAALKTRVILIGSAISAHLESLDLGFSPQRAPLRMDGGCEMRSPEQCLAELIEKMKALAESTPFAAEAATARALVQELIARNAQRPQHVPFVLDPDNLPPLLRESDIVRDSSRKYPGLVPLTRSAQHNQRRLHPTAGHVGLSKGMAAQVSQNHARGRPAAEAAAPGRALLRVTHKAEAEAARADENKPKKKAQPVAPSGASRRHPIKPAASFRCGLAIGCGARREEAYGPHCQMKPSRQPAARAGGALQAEYG